MRYIKKKNTLYTISIKNLYINLYTCLYLPGLHNCKLDGEHTYIIQFEYNSIIVFHTHTHVCLLVLLLLLLYIIFVFVFVIVIIIIIYLITLYIYSLIVYNVLEYLL